MEAETCLRFVVRPVVEWLDEHELHRGNLDDAEKWLLAVAVHESRLTHRRQFGRGPARGLWQFERSGFLGVMTHPRTCQIAGRWCRSFGFGLKDEHGELEAMQLHAAHQALAENDAFACGMARLLLFTHPRPIAWDMADGFKQYLELWRPGIPRQGDWGASWLAASRAFHLDIDKQQSPTTS